MDATLTSRWAPDGTPRRRHVASAILLAAWAVWKLGTADTVVWEATAVGFAAFAIATGPAAATSIGSRIGSRWRAIGYAGRVAAIVAFVFAVSSAVVSLDVSTALATSFAYGIVLGTAVIVAVEAIRSGGTADSETGS